MNKKAVSLPLQVIVIIIILLIVAAIIIFTFNKTFGDNVKILNQQTKDIGEQSQSIFGGDCDCDTIKDAFDPCPCGSDNSDGSCEKSITLCKEKKLCKTDCN